MILLSSICILKKLTLNLTCIKVDINMVKRHLLLDCTVTFLKVEHSVNKPSQKELCTESKELAPFRKQRFTLSTGMYTRLRKIVQTQPVAFHSKTALKLVSHHIRHIQLPLIQPLRSHTPVTCSQSIKASPSNPPHNYNKSSNHRNNTGHDRKQHEELPNNRSQHV